jgi:hypothetical protein
MRRICVTVVACLFIFGFITLAEAVRVSRVAGPVAIKATPITSFDNRDPSKTRFGTLEFRGGLVLSSQDEAFGGISAIHIESDGAHFLAATDQGSWLRGRIEYREGRPAGIADAEMAPILGADGKPLASHGWYDVESLAERDGSVYIGIERVEQVVQFNYRRDGLLARGHAISVPAEFKTFAYNKSLECLVAPREGAFAGELIAVTEHSLDNAGNLRSFVLGGEHTTHFSAKRSDDFDVSDCAILSPDDLLLLERRFSPARGVAMRIRRISLAEVKADAVVDGPAMIEADLGFQIDNMEGIAIHRSAAGETIVTLVSDDNFSVLQRTLLLQFAVVGN